MRNYVVSWVGIGFLLPRAHQDSLHASTKVQKRCGYGGLGAVHDKRLGVHLPRTPLLPASMFNHALFFVALF